MIRSMGKYLSPDYLFQIATETKFEPYYLGIAVAYLLIVIFLKVFLKIKGREKVYKSFDSLWFWGGVFNSFWGFFVWFSRNQALPFFGTRAFSYLWIIFVVFYNIYLIFYFRRKFSKKLEKYLEKKRKEKYLK